MSRYDDYVKYINSQEWQKKRKVRLEIDNFECRICGDTEGLQVHHKRYPKKLGTEDVSNDLTTFCARCHNVVTDMLREEKHKDSKMPEAFVDSPGEIPQDNSRDEEIPQTYLSSTRRRRIENVQRNKIPAQFIDIPHHAQWGPGQSNESLYHSNEEDHEQTTEDGSGS